MSTVFLGAAKAALDRVDTDLEVADPEGSVSLEALRKVVIILDDARLEFVLSLTAASGSSEFQELNKFIRRTRDAVYQVIRTIGDVDRDGRPLESGQELLSAISVHILLRQHVNDSAGQSISLSVDLLGLDSSMKLIMTRFDNYRGAVDALENNYRR